MYCKRCIIVFSAPLILLFGGCSDSTLNPNESANYSFPLKVGNRWEYVNTVVSWTEESPSDTTRSVSTGVWEITGTDVIDDIEAYRMEVHTTYIEGSNSGENGSIANWYAVAGDTLKWIAYSESNGKLDSEIQLHKTAEEYPIYESIADGWQAFILVTPLSIGKSWIVNPIFPFTGTKTVRAQETITVPAGTFDTFRISHDIDFEELTGPHQIDIYEIFTINSWYGDEGMLRHDTYTKVQHTEDGREYITQHKVVTTELTAYEIQ